MVYINWEQNFFKIEQKKQNEKCFSNQWQLRKKNNK